ncbi:hypothetical protein ZIOFF_074457 (mitochondrion) [Zingiber officinale]|uniref:NADH-ubiquinone oxidoreductase chain 1 n=1 Tax=Zingiber officinale TaxID=94328 RepID=A0A8J5C4U1_ZINOF|nr:hypothetical protein ZIOFF_075481 [Zingiber officinale]KAG6467662.1 hypothetical protein ZIOFF_074457 [Zingiber officinale]
MREDRGPEQVGLGYRAISAMGGALRSAAQMVSYEVSIGLILIVRLCAVPPPSTMLSHRSPSSEIVMAQKQIWSGIPLFPVLVMFFISCLAETNRAPFDLPEAEAESVAGYNVEYARDAILNSPQLAEANVPGSRGLILTETRGGSRCGRALFILHSKLMNVRSGVSAFLSKRELGKANSLLGRARGLVK